MSLGDVFNAEQKAAIRQIISEMLKERDRTSPVKIKKTIWAPLWKVTDEEFETYKSTVLRDRKKRGEPVNKDGPVEMVSAGGRMFRLTERERDEVKSIPWKDGDIQLTLEEVDKLFRGEQLERALNAAEVRELYRLAEERGLLEWKMDPGDPRTEGGVVAYYQMEAEPPKLEGPWEKREEKPAIQREIEEMRKNADGGLGIVENADGGFKIIKVPPKGE